MHWLKYCSETNSNLWSVDIDPRAIATATEAWSRFLGSQIIPTAKLVQTDSVEFLTNFNEKIDLLFLDSLDSPPHQLKELKAAWDKLNLSCFVLIDDVFNDRWDGKGKESIPYLLENGFKLEYFIDRQVLLSRC